MNVHMRFPGGKIVYNPTVTDVFFELNGKKIVSVKPGETVTL